jgi:uncharacterized membrane protein
VFQKILETIMILSSLSHINMLELISLGASTIFVMLIPGFIWSYVFFDPRKKDAKKISIGERILWGIALSLALVPFSIFILIAMFDVAINVQNVITIVIFLSLLGVLTFFIKEKMPSWGGRHS